MSCEELSEELSAYLDGELSPDERTALEAHLERCPRWREELGSLRAVSELLASLPRVEPSEEFSQVLAESMSARRPRRWLRPIPLFAGDLVPALAVAAMVLIAATVTFIIPLFTSPGSRAQRYDEPLDLPSEVSAPPAQPEAPTERLADAKFADGEAKSETDGDRVAGGESAPALGRQLVELEDEGTASNVARGRAITSALPPEDADHRSDSLKDDRSAGLLAKGDTQGMAQSAPAMSSAVKEAKEERALQYRAGRESAPTVSAESAGGVGGARRVAQAEAPGDAPSKADERVVHSTIGAGFRTVVLHCSDPGAGQQAFNAALGEFNTLKTPGPDLVTVRRMSLAELRRYSQLLRSLHESPDVVTFKEIKVPASDLQLVEAVFADKADLTYADPNTDVDRLRSVLTSTRKRPRAREEPPRSVGVRGGWQEARQRADTPTRPDQELVDVILVLKRTSGSNLDQGQTIRRGAPNLRNTR